MKMMSKELTMTSAAYKLGVNYLPAEFFVFFWDDFREEIVQRDFNWLSERGYRVIRFFLLWEAFQPHPKRIKIKALKNLARLVQRAAENNLHLIPTLFVGHMSGLNFLPSWVLQKAKTKGPFPIYSKGKIRNLSPRNFFKDQELIDPQRALVKEITEVLRDYPNIMAIDLGNEPSNVYLPEEEDLGQWLEVMVGEIKSRASTPVTIGLHQEDLLRKSAFAPSLVQKYCDVLSMHIYPFYLPFLQINLDPSFPLFIWLLTQWLSGQNKEVMIEEMGAASLPLKEEMKSIPLKMDDFKGSKLFKEEEIADYYKKSLSLLISFGVKMILLWCYSDYVPTWWDKPPFNEKIHERYFGLRSWTGREKPYSRVAQEIKINQFRQPNFSWIDLERDAYFEHPKENMRRLFIRFKSWLEQLEGCL